MKIDVLCNDGSPLGVTSKTIWGDDYRVGVGGAELALITMCEEWHKHGYEVVLFNDPFERGASLFEQRNISEFDPNEKRDVLVIFRSPNLRSIPVNNCLKVWWSCDQFTTGDFKLFSGTVDKIVCISPFHKEYFLRTYGIDNAIDIDLPVREDDYLKIQNGMKISNRIIYTSIPDRGLMNLWRIWPKLKKEIPDASLVITSDYRLWGVGHQNEHHKIKWIVQDGVEFIGAVNRIRLIQEQLKAELFLYPCSYEELFCIAVAEAQFVGVYPITSSMGALPYTNMGTVINGNGNDPRLDGIFLEKAVEFLRNENKIRTAYDVQKLAVTRFNPQRILKEWDERVFNEEDEE